MVRNIFSQQELFVDSKDYDRYWYEIDGKCLGLQRYIVKQMIKQLQYCNPGNYYNDFNELLKDLDNLAYGWNNRQASNLLSSFGSTEYEVLDWTCSSLYDGFSGDDEEFENYINSMENSNMLMYAIINMLYLIPNYAISDETLNNDFWIRNDFTYEDNMRLKQELEEYLKYIQ